MAILATTNPTLVDLANAMDPDGSIAEVVELLQQKSEILQDMSWQEGNLMTGHQSTVRTGIANGTWRKLYGFVQPTKTTRATITDTAGMLEKYSVVDKAFADLNGNTAAFRMSEERGEIMGLNNQVAQAIFYSNESTAPEQITGLTPRYNDLAAPNAENIIDAAGAGTDNGSIWLVVWGPDSVFGFVPKGSTAGLQVTDKGQVTDTDNVGGLREVYRTHYRWDLGVTVKDWRQVVRIANIDKSDLSVVYTAGAFASGAHLPNLMFQAMNRVWSLREGRAAFYMSRDMMTTLQQQLSAATQSSTLAWQDVGGIITPMFNGIPIRRVDALAADEAAVT